MELAKKDEICHLQNEKLDGTGVGDLNSWLTDYIQAIQQHFTSFMEKLQSLKYANQTNNNLTNKEQLKKDFSNSIELVIANFVESVRKASQALKENNNSSSPQPSVCFPGNSFVGNPQFPSLPGGPMSLPQNSGEKQDPPPSCHHQQGIGQNNKQIEQTHQNTSNCSLVNNKALLIDKAQTLHFNNVMAVAAAKQMHENNASILNTLLQKGNPTASDVPNPYLHYATVATSEYDAATMNPMFPKMDSANKMAGADKSTTMPLSVLNLQREMTGPIPPRYEAAAAMFVGYEPCAAGAFPPDLIAKAENGANNFHSLTSKSAGQQQQLTGDGHFECAICKQVLRSAGEFATHVVMQHRTIGTAQGSPVKQSDGVGSSVNNSQQSQHPIIYQCPLCPFTTDKSLQCHLQQEHVGERPYICQLCRKSFFARDKLARHLMIHTQERPFSCQLCDKRFLTKDKLERHVYVHTGFKPFQCQLCDKKFSSKYTLNQHLFVHSRNGPLPCHHCDKKFVAKSELQRHLFAHSTGALDVSSSSNTNPSGGNEENPCHFCGKRFQSRNKLEAHMFVHAGDANNPFQCDRCTRKFAYRYDLDRHSLAHSGEKPFKCQVCGMGFGRKYRLTTHHKAYHQDMGGPPPTSVPNLAA